MGRKRIGQRWKIWSLHSGALIFVLAMSVVGVWGQTAPPASTPANVPHVDLIPTPRLPATTQKILKEASIEIPKKWLRAQNFRGTPVNNAQMELNGYKKKVILLNFWATWCTPCLKEMPDLQKVHQQLGTQGVIVLAVGMGETAEKIQQFALEHKLTFPMIADPNMDISRIYGVQNLPVTYLINPDQVLIGRAIGPREWASTEMMEVYRQQLHTER